MITVFDIETHPLPEDYCLQFLPDKIGNTTDPVKVKEKFLKDLALHAKTSYIACIGYRNEAGNVIRYWGKSVKPSLELILHESEKTIIEGFYGKIEQLTKTNLLVGHNCFNFDLPFIVQRGYIHGINPPDGLRKGRYWNDCIKDTSDLWTCGVYGSYIHLWELAEIFNVGHKEKKGGANFPTLWDTDPEKAIEYLKNDLDITYKVATKLL